jgi:hypothetical protein
MITTISNYQSTTTFDTTTINTTTATTKANKETNTKAIKKIYKSSKKIIELDF